jgi:hypothetical protein
MTNWNPYLESVCKQYVKWWTFYTLTDVEDRQGVNNESPLLDFMMVETVQPINKINKVSSQEQVKTERLPVVEGLQKSKYRTKTVGHGETEQIVAPS